MDTYDTGLIIEALKNAFDVQTDKQLADTLDAGTTSAISNWRMRNSVPWKQVVEAHLKTGCTVASLLTGQPESADNETATRLVIHPRDHSFLPIFDLDESAKQNVLIESDSVHDLIGFDNEFLKTKFGLTKDNAGFVNIVSDAMYPTLSEGELALINTDVTSFNSDGIYLFKVNNQLLVKRIQLLPTGSINIISDNQKYSNFELSQQQIDESEIVIYGRLSVGIRRL